MRTRTEKNLIGLYTMLRKDVLRIFRIWSQTLLPPLVTTTLYFAIFGALIGSQLPQTGDYTYMQFIMPGLVMMTIITSSYMHVSSIIFMMKFQRNIDEVLVSPMPRALIVGGFLAGGIVRSLIVGVLVTAVSLMFTHIEITHASILFAAAFLSSIIFSAAGFLNALFAKSFDGINIVPTFVLTPLTYFGGVFYSLSLLPSFWQDLSLLNPILYMVNSFRYGFLGVSDVDIVASFIMMISLAAALSIACFVLFRRGIGVEK